VDQHDLRVFNKIFQRNVCEPQDHHFYPDRCLCRLEIQMPATGNVSVRSNATLISRNVMGTFTAEYDPNISDNNVYMTVHLQTTSPALRNSTLICYDNAGEDRGLEIFVCIPSTFQIYQLIHSRYPIISRAWTRSPWISMWLSQCSKIRTRYRISMFTCQRSTTYSRICRISSSKESTSRVLLSQST